MIKWYDGSSLTILSTDSKKETMNKETSGGDTEYVMNERLQKIVITEVFLMMVPGLFVTMVLTVGHLNDGKDILTMFWLSSWPLLVSCALALVFAFVTALIANAIDAR